MPTITLNGDPYAIDGDLRLSALLERLNGMPAGTIPEPLAMEFTTGLLLARSGRARSRQRAAH